MPSPVYVESGRDSRGERERTRERQREREPDLGAMRRVPTAAPEMVRTGVPFSRAGGGEVEIPAWFEAAARKMLADRSGGGGSDGISLAELTLVTSAPSSQIAADSRGTVSHSAPAAPETSGGAAGHGKQGKDNADEIAQKVYDSILQMIEVERMRNGEPTQ